MSAGFVIAAAMLHKFPYFPTSKSEDSAVNLTKKMIKVTTANLSLIPESKKLEKVVELWQP